MSPIVATVLVGTAVHRQIQRLVKKRLTALRADMDAAAREEADRVLGEMETGAFLPKQTTTDNGVIPHQLHEQELCRILERAARYLPFLSEVDESGLSAREKILAIFRFRIPYYVGPLDTRSEHSWAVRTHEKIYPWNFDRVVDRARSAQRFIERMTARCSYIGEPVLPRDSLLYSRFAALNMLNNCASTAIPSPWRPSSASTTGVSSKTPAPAASSCAIICSATV